MERNKDRRRVGTLGDLRQCRHDLYLNCERTGCGHSVRVPLDPLIERFGAAFPLQAVLDRAVCTVCGARWPEVGCQRVPKPEYWAGPREHKVTPLKSQPSLDRPNLGSGQDGPRDHLGPVDAALRIADHDL